MVSPLHAHLAFVTKYRYWRANRLWSASYFAGSVGGASISFLRQYIDQQDQPV